MDKLEFYESNILKIALTKIMDEVEIAQILKDKLNNDTAFMNNLIEIRKSLLTDNDSGLSYDILKGQFPLSDKNKVAALVAMVIEIKKANRIHFKILSFEAYHSSQPVFQKHPELLDKLRMKPNKN